MDLTGVEFRHKLELVKKKRRIHLTLPKHVDRPTKHHPNSFCHFLEQPQISLAFLVIGLVALLFSVLEFSEAVELVNSK